MKTYDELEHLSVNVKIWVLTSLKEKKSSKKQRSEIINKSLLWITNTKKKK